MVKLPTRLSERFNLSTFQVSVFVITLHISRVGADEAVSEMPSEIYSLSLEGWASSNTPVLYQVLALDLM